MHFTTRHGLLSEGIQDVAVDTVLGMVWFAHDNGVTGYKRDDVRGTEKNMTDKAYEDVKVYPIPFRPKLQPYISFFNVADDAVLSSWPSSLRFPCGLKEYPLFQCQVAG